MCKDSGFISENNISSTSINEFNLYVQSHKYRTSFYPHVVLELQDTTTNETKWWCYADFHDEDLCKELGVKDLTGCTLDKQPSHGTWISKEDIGHL